MLIISYLSDIPQGLKFSGTVPDLRRVAFGCEKKKIVLHFKNLVDIMFEFAYQ